MKSLSFFLVFILDLTLLLLFPFNVFCHTIGGSIGQQEIRQQAFLDGGITTQGLLV